MDTKALPPTSLLPHLHPLTPSRHQANFTKTLLLPGGVIGKGNMRCQANITETLLIPGGVIRGNLGGGICNSRASQFAAGLLTTLPRGSRPAPGTPPQLLLQPANTSRLPFPPCDGAFRLIEDLDLSKIFQFSVDFPEARLHSYLEAEYTRVMVAKALHLKRFSMYKAGFNWRGMYKAEINWGVCPRPPSLANFVRL